MPRDFLKSSGENNNSEYVHTAMTDIEWQQTLEAKRVTIREDTFQALEEERRKR
jgi:hypothetical protein